MAATQHFLDLGQFTKDELRKILDLAHALKAKLKEGEKPPLLEGKMLAMIFDRESTRTRVSFDVGMRQLGGQTLMLTGDEMQLSRDETIADTARVMSRYVDAIMIRLLSHDDLEEMAAAATIPVINGLTRFSHPCQIMADILTYEEHRGSIEGIKIAWQGDCNNVLMSWIQAANHFNCELKIACPEQYKPNQAMQAEIDATNGRVQVTQDPLAAMQDADLVITDTWVSMGDLDATIRREILSPHRVTAELMAEAKPDALFMHCLPAHRGDEVTSDVLDGPQSVVFDEAENRLHAQKAILCWVFGIEELK
ncbi:ornithine carbamoyltransferase [Maritalea mediterranea]|uniref:Ornithine carbamoyltransferase n=1 Tax=Maritalea mediterranea TaxID=2909667 RepID=A0ABS9E3Z1_9HYPH|nr:ornithine carbamoyltransferase [Maritalea mediterranea]MCF4097587.1 ornithine carbamoyltransferase [Maritalea mediterranea]